MTAADANLLVEAGVRYSLPRKTGVYSDARAWISWTEAALEPETIAEIRQAVRVELARDHDGSWRPDREGWVEVLDWLETLPEQEDPAASAQIGRRSMFILIVSAARYAMSLRSLDLQRRYAQACERYVDHFTANEREILVRDIDDELRLVELRGEIDPEWPALADRLRPGAAPSV